MKPNPDTCPTCKQEIKHRQFVAGDMVQTVWGTTAIVPDTFLEQALDQRYGGEVSPNCIRLVALTGFTFVARRDELTVRHGIIRITDHVVLA